MKWRGKRERKYRDGGKERKMKGKMGKVENHPREEMASRYFWKTMK